MCSSALPAVRSSASKLSTSPASTPHRGLPLALSASCERVATRPSSLIAIRRGNTIVSSARFDCSFRAQEYWPPSHSSSPGCSEDQPTFEAVATPKANREKYEETDFCSPVVG